jgi:O-antigen ligase
MVLRSPAFREVYVRFKLLSSIIASASLVAAPVMAQTASSAAKLSVARAGAPVSGEKLAEGSGGIIAAVLVAGIVAIGVLAATQDDDPESA